MMYLRTLFAVVGLVLAASAAPAVADAPNDEAHWQAIQQLEQARIRVIESVRPTVVSIFGEVRGGGGAGVLISSDGLVLTNYHVVAGAGSTEGVAGLADGVLYPWKLIGLDPGGDLALIQLANDPADKPFPYATLGSAASLKQGDWVMAMGNPFALNEDLRPTVTMGIVSGLQRYQGGTGPNKTMLVYGNCIQVDTSINPGNSGGPLFDMTGRVVGINGRASFESRGRVNVGLGYAISAEQCRYFLPELLAAKVAQHGWLNEATFDDRGGRVVCDQIDPDSPVAAAGLMLGDELLEFNGAKIQTANQYTNLISMLPANWPVTLKVRSGYDEPRIIRLRLGALDYGPVSKAQPEPDDEEPDKGKRKLIPGRGLPIKAKPGEIIDKNINRAMAERLLRLYRQTLGGDAALSKVKAIRETLVYHGSQGAKIKVESVSTLDGRFQSATTTPDGAVRKVQWDGKQWLIEEGDTQTGKPADDAHPRREVALQTALLALLRPDGADHFEKLKLEGADEARGHITARLAAADRHGNKFRFWFGLYNKDGEIAVRLIKHAVLAEKNADQKTFFVGKLRSIGPARYAPTIMQVKGPQDRPIARFEYEKIEALTEWPEGFQPAEPPKPDNGRDDASPRAIDPPPVATFDEGLPNVFASAVTDAQQRCVKIYGAGIGREKGYASGVIVSDDGLILTAQGLYLIGQRIMVAMPDGTVHRAKLVRSNNDIQTALLKIDAETPDYFDIPSDPQVQPGDWVLALANPFKVADFEERLSVNLGVVSMRAALDTRRRAQDFDVEGEVLLIDAITSNPGSAGGALVGLDGRLVGLIGKLLESQSTNTRLNYAIPADLLRRFLDGQPVIDTPANDAAADAAPGYIGARLFTLSGPRAPAYIDRVLPGSPAADAGLKRDDLILAVNDQVVRNIRHYTEIAKTIRADQAYRFMLKRGTEIIELTVTAKAKP